MLFPYIIKLSISLSVVYLFYVLLLRRLTFYTLNRWFLLAYSMICFVIPFVNIFALFNKPALQDAALIQYIPIIQVSDEAPADHSIDPLQVVLACMFIGMLVMTVRLFVQYYSLFKIRAKAQLLYNNDVKLYHINEPVIPFSFGNSIYINQYQHSEEELKDIIKHEFIHVKQWHSFDIIWSELLCIINWYNPFAWLLKKDIRQNLEFIADRQVLESGLDRKQYQYLLLKVVGIQSFSIANKFNFSSLKKRIAMMNKTKTAKVHVLRFLFMLPLLVIILLAFRNVSHQQPVPGPYITTLTDTVPGNAAKCTHLTSDDIISVDINKTDNRQLATIRLKNGQVDQYDLKDAAQKAAMEAKYGALITPPPPPAPPAAGERIAEMRNMDFDKEHQQVTITLANGVVEKYNLKDPKEKEAFETRYFKIPVGPPPPPSVDFQVAMSKTVHDIENVVVSKDKNTVTITLKSGQVDKYNLNDPKQKAALEAKYGPLVPTPPPPPPAPAMAAKGVADIKRMDVDKANNSITMRLKDGRVEEYNLNKEADRNAFQEKYGDVAPATPTPPAAIGGKITPNQIEAIDVRKPGLLTITLKTGEVMKYDLTDPKQKADFDSKYDHTAPPAPAAPPVPAAADPYAPATDVAIGVVTDNPPPHIVTITKKDGTVETYNWNNAADRSAYEKKYPKPQPLPVSPAIAAARAQIERVDLKDKHILVITMKNSEVYQYDLNDVVQVANLRIKFGPISYDTPLHSDIASISSRSVANVSVSGGPEAVNVPRTSDASGSFIAVIKKSNSENQLQQLQKDLFKKGYDLEIKHITAINGSLTSVSGGIGPINGKKSYFDASDFSQIMILQGRDAGGNPDRLHIIVGREPGKVL